MKRGSSLFEGLQGETQSSPTGLENKEVARSALTVLKCRAIFYPSLRDGDNPVAPILMGLRSAALRVECSFADPVKNAG